MNDDEKLRLECLRLALDVEKAEAYYRFVTLGRAAPGLTAEKLRAEFKREAESISRRHFSPQELLVHPEVLKVLPAEEQTGNSHHA